MSPGHNGAPDPLHIGCVRLLPVVVVAAPDAAGKVGRVTDEPAVAGSRRRSALPGNRNAVEIRVNAGSVGNHVLEGRGEQGCRVISHDRVGGGRVVDQDISVVIDDLCVVDRLHIEAASAE